MTGIIGSQSISTLQREQRLIALLAAFLVSGLIFMILPGTFLGVWNLFTISSAQSSHSVSPAWIQAHGHAQLFGWLGSFILGIGFYSIPNVRTISAPSFPIGWISWFLWTVGVGLHWFAGVASWHWRIIFPVSAFMELAAVLLFLLVSIIGHKTEQKRRRTIQPWALLVIAGTLGLVIAMLVNVYMSVILALHGTATAFSATIDSRFLVLSVWGFPVLVAWGFSAHWMPVFLGLRPIRTPVLLSALLFTILGIATSLSNNSVTSPLFLLAASISAIIALGIFENPHSKAKTQGVHKSFPFFVRLAYLWLFISSLLNVWSGIMPDASGIAGAGRHAITVGFLMTMVFSVAPRILPPFLGKSKLFSTRLMFFALAVTNAGCFIRVTSEILAYQNYAAWAWLFLPISAILELIGVILFTLNMSATLMLPPTISTHCRQSSAN